MQTNLYEIFKPINLILLVNFILVISSPSILVHNDYITNFHKHLYKKIT